MNSMTKVKEEIVLTAKQMYRAGMVTKFEGNISVRVGDTILITPSQQSKETMDAGMILEVDREGRMLHPENGLRPSSELAMHLKVYGLRPDVGACVHNHSVYASAFAVAGLPIDSCGIAEANLLFGEIPVVPYGTPGTSRLFAQFDRYLGYRRAVLLENHGVLTMGETLEEAAAFAETVEKIAKTLVMARLLGGEKTIPAQELAALRQYGEKMREAGAKQSEKNS